MNDISYGREAEKWPREYSTLARRIQFLRFNDYPVKLVSGNGQSIIGYISKFNQKENMILASDEAKEGANKQVISSQADSLIKISRIWADFFPANTSNQPI